MRVTLSLSKLYTGHDLTQKPLNDVVERIGSQLGAVEEVIDLGAQYQGVIIARVVHCDDHPNADRLRVCAVDDGGVVEGVDRDEHGYVQVVCGAPNVREGLSVAWLPPGATVPSTYGKDDVVLTARELRGVVSNGMMASSKELGLSDDHDGILEIEGDVKPGTRFADHYHLNDSIIDIENKMFTHRPDCFGLIGVYREIAGIYHEQFASPEWYTDSNAYTFQRADQILPLEIVNELPDLVPRFMAVAMSGLSVGPSPVWLQTNLLRAGIRPINNVVDITNFVMYLTGQPLHAYDYDKVKALGGGDRATLGARYPKKGETIKLLNGKTITPRPEAIMITTGDHLIGLGGVMGGSETEVDESTTSIILECATFDMYSVRRTSMAHGLFTDAASRFNKGQSPLQNPYVLAKAMREVTQLAGGTVASEIVDDDHISGEVAKRRSLFPPINVEVGFINERLGLALDPDRMVELLRHVEFKVALEGATLHITAPFWRTDIEIPEDIVEEIGRLHGYDHIPLALPTRTITPAVKSPEIESYDAVRRTLRRAGANEVMTYSFVRGDHLSHVGQDPSLAFRLGNALSPELEFYRLSLTPSLLSLVHANHKAGYDQCAIFEISKVHGKTEIDDDGLPREFARVGFVFSADDKVAARRYDGAPYYQAKLYVTHLFDSFGGSADLVFKPLGESDFGEHKLFEQLTRPFEPNRSAVVWRGDRLVGVVGEYRASVRRYLKLPIFAAGFEVFGSALRTVAHRPYQPLPRFPKVEQDVSLRLPSDVKFDELFGFVQDEVEKIKPDATRASLVPLDIYTKPGDSTRQQITLRLSIASFERTLKAEEINDLLDRVASAAGERFDAVRV